MVKGGIFGEERDIEVVPVVSDVFIVCDGTVSIDRFQRIQQHDWDGIGDFVDKVDHQREHELGDFARWLYRYESPDFCAWDSR